MTKEKVYFMGLLANVDSSILDLKLKHGFKFVSMEEDEAFRYLSIFEKAQPMDFMKPDISAWIPCMNDEDNMFFVTNDFDCDLGEGKPFPNDLVKFLNELEDQYLRKVIRQIRLFKEGNICMPRMYCYRYDKEIPVLVHQRWSTLDIEHQMFYLDSSEADAIEDFIHRSIIPFKKSYLDLAFTNLELSYRISNRNLKFLTLMIGLEALFNQGGSEITYKISRGLATLIGEDKDNTEHIFKRMYKSKIDGKKGLYNLRSEIVHDGKPNTVNDEDVLELRDYLRRAIKEVSIINKGKKELADLLNSSGFDEKSWKK